MQRTFTTKDGDTLDVECSKLEPVAAYLLVAKLGKILLPALVAMRQGKETDLQPVIGQMFDSLPPELAREVMLDLFRPCVVVKTNAEGKQSKHDLALGQPEVDKAFRGSLKTLFQALGFAFEVNFGDFFDASALVERVTRTQSV